MTEIQKIIKDLRPEAFYIGEDGDMACFANTELGAFRKFKKRIREDCGESDTEEMSRENIGIGWIRLPTKEEKEEYGDECDWFVTYEKESEYQVWAYRV